MSQSLNDLSTLKAQAEETDGAALVRKVSKTEVEVTLSTRSGETLTSDLTEAFEECAVDDIDGDYNIGKVIPPSAGKDLYTLTGTFSVDDDDQRDEAFDTIKQLLGELEYAVTTEGD